MINSRNVTRILSIVLFLCFLQCIGCVQKSKPVFHGIPAVSPALRGAWPTEINTLRPNLCWQPMADTSITYDISIWQPPQKKQHGLLVPSKTTSGGTQITGPQIYYRKGLSGKCHVVEIELRPGTIFYWSVRWRKGDEKGSWSTYSGKTSVTTGSFGDTTEILRGTYFKILTPSR